MLRRLLAALLSLNFNALLLDTVAGPSDQVFGSVQESVIECVCVFVFLNNEPILVPSQF